MTLEMVKIARNNLNHHKLENIDDVVQKELRKLFNGKIQPGMQVAVTAGSRGINQITVILRAAVKMIESYGARPVIVGAMGSHGGGTAEGQKAILNKLGITEETIGAPVMTSITAVQIGTTARGVPVYTDDVAAAADAILIVNRIKSHPNFRGPQESGIYKMMAVGLGKPKGAKNIHKHGVEHLQHLIPEIGEFIKTSLPVIGALAITENANNEVNKICGLLPEEFGEKEASLLKEAREAAPCLPFEDIDVLIIDEMGKEYNGLGIDNMLVGRMRVQGISEPETPRVKRIIVLDLSAASGGNAIGMGLADFITRKLYDKINFQATYLNTLTGGSVLRGFIPIVLDNDREAVKTALESIPPAGRPSGPIVIRLKNTLQVNEMYISAALAQELREKDNDYKEIGRLEALKFKENGEIASF